MNDLISRADIEWHDYFVADGNGMYHDEKIAYKSQIDMMPSAQPEERTQMSSADLISRQAAITAIHKYFEDEIKKQPFAVDEDGDEICTDMATVNRLLEHNKGLSKLIKELRSDVRENRTGKWRTEEQATISGALYTVCICDQCGEDFVCETDFCPSCGADMRKERAE